MMLRLASLLFSLFALVSCNPKKQASSEGEGESQSPATPASTPEGSIAITAAEPSPHFAAVMQHLDVGGKVLHYNDHEGRREFWIELISFIMTLAEEEGELDLPADFSPAKLVDSSGMMDVVASGRSISRDGDDWLMRQYSHFASDPSEAVGLMGKAQPFELGKRLSAGTDIAMEMRLDGSSLPGTMRSIAGLMGQAEDVEQTLTMEMPLGMTVEALLGLFEAHIMMGMELVDTGEKEMPVIPGNWVMEMATHKKIVDALLPILEDGMGKPKAIGKYQGWPLEVPEAPGMGKPVLVLKGEDGMVIASTAEYLAELEADGPKLGSDPSYKSATNHFPDTGNMIAYVSPEVPAAIGKWMNVLAMNEPDALHVIRVARKLVPEKPWSVCMATSETGLHTTAEMPFAMDVNSTTMMVALGGTSTLFVGARAWKRGADRSAVIMNIRNCQQAMRGHQNLHGLKAGEPFTRKDLEQYMQFPQDIKVSGGWIRFEAGDIITPEASNPPANDDHIWLKVTGPGMDGVVGTYGFADFSEVTGW